MSYIMDIWNSSKSCPKFWDCKIIGLDGDVNTNKLFLCAFGSRDFFPIGMYSEISRVGENFLVIFMKDFTMTEIQEACQAFTDILPLSEVNYGIRRSFELCQEILPSEVVQSESDETRNKISGPTINNDQLQPRNKMDPNFCQVCGKVFKTLKLFSVHLYQQHPTTPADKFPCPQCSRKFHHNFQLTKHMKIVHSDIFFQCPQCDLKYKSRKALNYHRKCVHKI